ncbi:low molecular weight protein-tyrosine-phosphatase [Desertihabitans aurantiacus]|uniref:low molecular weight protein-tyrosine-phosphatase n=1 Tax=Desertihabitans aurantiacus TaxID=2282477 RepID=UPI0022B7F7AA|nr:low molecular weight protein-tyrosine-phosphatase [Desertihabitans aurantiacus]
MSGSPTGSRRVVFVCWGNICRSPMAERVARSWAADQGGLDDVEFSSAGVSREELGNPIDPRARAWLRRHGHDADGHSAHQVDAEEIAGAELVVAMEELHVRRMEQITGRVNDNVRLLTEFDPGAPEGAGVPDPWYGDEEGFGDTMASIEAAMPGLLATLRGDRTDAG